MTELSIPSHLLGARWAQREGCQSRGGELLWRADLTRGGADCFKSTLPNVIPESSQDRSGQDRNAVETIETFCWTYGIIGRQQSQLCRFKYWNFKKPPGSIGLK